mgnify:CR=1 FL=1
MPNEGKAKISAIDMLTQFVRISIDTLFFFVGNLLISFQNYSAAKINFDIVISDDIFCSTA